MNWAHVGRDEYINDTYYCARIKELPTHVSLLYRHIYLPELIIIIIINVRAPSVEALPHQLPPSRLVRDVAG